MNRINRLTVLLFLLGATGCADLTEDTAKQEPKGPRVTDEIGEFDPNAGKEVVDPKVTVTNPITAPLEAYQPLKEKVSMIPVIQGIQVFNATEGRYPRDHAEFMDKVIKANGIKLPVLPAGKKYEYDVANHQLVIVQDPAAAGQ